MSTIKADNTTHLESVEFPEKETKEGLQVIYLEGSTHLEDVDNENLRGDAEQHRKVIANLTRGDVEHLSPSELNK